MTALWWYVSFTDDSGFLGGAYVPGETDVLALARATELGIRPGGDAMIVGPMPEDGMDENVPPADRERLLTMDELDGVKIDEGDADAAISAGYHVHRYGA